MSENNTIAEFNKFDLEQELKVARRLMKTEEGRLAFKETLLRTPEGRKLVHSEFGIAIVDKAQDNDKPVVAILIPTHKKWENETSSALEQMVPYSRDAAHVVVRPGIASSVVHWVRNQLLSSLYESGVPFTHVLFCDDDMAPPPNALTTLLERNVDVVGAVCTVRQDPPLPNARHFSPEAFAFSTADIDQPGIWTVGAIGTGFLLLTKKVLDAVGEYYLNCGYEQKYLGMDKATADIQSFGRKQAAEKSRNLWWFEFLKHPRGEGEYGEDISFCFKARECGFEIYADSTIQVGHVGDYLYGLGDYWQYRDEAIAQGKVVPIGEALKTGEKISILVPTRGRPDNVTRLVKSINETGTAELVLYLDSDDEQLLEMMDDILIGADRGVIGTSHSEGLRQTGDGAIKFVVGPRRVLSECWNECAKVATGDILMVGSDDIVFRTKGWDEQVRSAFAKSGDKILMVFGDDGAWGDRFATHPIVHRKWYETLGYVTPPHFSGDYCDTWINDIAVSLGRRVYLPFVNEHLHPIWGKGKDDATYIEKAERAKKDNVVKKYEELLPQRQADMDKLHAVMQKEVAAHG